MADRYRAKDETHRTERRLTFFSPNISFVRRRGTLRMLRRVDIVVDDAADE